MIDHAYLNLFYIRFQVGFLKGTVHCCPVAQFSINRGINGLPPNCAYSWTFSGVFELTFIDPVEVNQSKRVIWKGHGGRGVSCWSWLEKPC